MKGYFKNIFAAASVLASFFCAGTPLHCRPVPVWGAVAQSKDETKAAHAHYEKAMKLKDASARFKLLQEGAVRYPFSAELHYALGREFHQRAQMDSALAHFEAVLRWDATLARKAELYSFLPQAYGAIAQQALQQGKLEEAERAAQKALQHDADNLAALNVTTMTAYQRKQYEQALAYGTRLLKLQPSARNHNNLGAVYEARQELTSAEHNYQQAVLLDPTLAEAQKNLQRVRARAQELIAEAKRQELAPPAAAKPSNTPRPKVEPKTKTNAPIRVPSAAKTPATASIKLPQSAAPTQAAIKTDSTLARHKPLPTPTSRAVTPPMEWNRVRAPKRDTWATTTWIIAAVALVLLVWHSLKYKRVQGALNKLKKIFPMRTAAPPRHAAAPVSRLVVTRMNAEDARMLRRIEAEQQPLLLPATTSGNVAPQFAQPLLAPERARPAMPAPVVPVAPEPIGLQTELLFAEMIAASPEAFENANLAAETKDNSNSNGKYHGEVIFPERERLHESAGEASETQEKDATLPQTYIDAEWHEVTPKIVAVQEVPPPQYFPEVQTPRPFEHIANTVLEKTPAPLTATPSFAELATQTLALPTLSVQRIGRYVIEKELAQGTTGKIYKAWDPKLDRIVVLKTVQYALSASATEVAALKDRIYREARAIAKLNHPNIVIVYDVDDQPEFSFLVMEYLEGRDLKQVLEKEHRLEWKRAVQIVLQVCHAMEYAHRAGVFHRDVKPSNIMLLGQDEVKVMDFGIAKISNYLSLTQTGRVFGTPSYMAPEQIEGHTTDGRADLFSLGIVLYELLVGKRPFVADSLAALAYKIVHRAHLPPSLENVELPIALDEVLQLALAKKPEERYQSAAELSEALIRLKNQTE